MGRIIIKKELLHTKLANSYGGWIYCDNCNETIGYLCYVTYKSINMSYTCNCGSKGNISIQLDEIDSSSKVCQDKLVTIKNRLCCTNDQSPLLTVLSKKLKTYSFDVVCNECNMKFIDSDTDQ